MPRVREAPSADAALIERTRRGDRAAYGELWQRHAPAARTVARSFSSLDPDDLVSESFTRIYDMLLAGGGPQGAFRPYLFTTVRNTAASWGRARHETTLETLESFEDPSTNDAATLEALDRSTTAQAFRSLPTRWQEVLWYSEVERMSPAQIAPLVGMSANSTAALAYRAREGLRQAWIRAHLRDAKNEPECDWSIQRLGTYTRGKLGNRETARLEAHLDDCARCTIVAAEAREVGSRLALVLLPLVAGVGGATAYSAWLSQGAPVSNVALGAAPIGFTGDGGAGGAASSATTGTGTGGAGASGVGAGGASAGGAGVSAAAIGAGVGVLTLAAAVVAVAVVLPSWAPAEAGTAPDAAAAAPDHSVDTAPPPSSSPESQPTPIVDPAEPGAEADGPSVVPVPPFSRPGTRPAEPTAPPSPGEPTVPRPLDPGATPGPTPSPTPTPTPIPTPTPTPTPTPEPEPPVDTVADPPSVDSADTAGGLVDPILAGAAEPGALVEAAVDGRLQTTTADAQGRWTLAFPDLPAGTTTLALTQTDAAGNRSAAALVPITLSSPQLVLSPDRGGWRGEYRGAPGTTVELRIGRWLSRDVLLDGNGRAVASGNLIELISNFAEVSVRYTSGDRTGPAAGITRG
ncbi:sigma-70 family RNA polymerase sigma factor [Agromyces sp. Marseille-Q5079]|uniref:sigma-70 family RNA polymerase sigma factor n=1 Tax=Agromyces sp. Marseille-Q5079 TaxID=3439059 RepID=UPI003D9CB516